MSRNRLIDHPKYGPVDIMSLQTLIDKDAAGPKSPIPHRTCNGIRMESRWSVLSELDEMERVVIALPQLTARRIQSIWCDSKAQRTYDVEIRQGHWIDRVRIDVFDAIVDVLGGMNGLRFIEAEIVKAWLDPYWAFDEEELGGRT